MTGKKYFIGIDGGGTYTKAVAVTGDGAVVCHEKGDTINFYSAGFEQAEYNLKAVLDKVTEQLPKEEIAYLFIGCSALDTEAEQEQTRRLLGPYSNIESKMNSDLYIALCGYAIDAPGILIISGTGSMGIARDAKGGLHTCGGWGYGIGDEGSAYDIAVKGINAAICYYDGIGEETILGEAVLKHYRLKHLKELIEEIYQPELNRKKIAGFAVEVSACALQGDRVARNILKGAAGSLADIADSLIKSTGVQEGIGIYGGVFENCGMVKDYFINILHAKYPGLKISYPRLCPELGAAFAAMKEKNIEITEAMIKKAESACLCGGSHGKLLS